jgi:hypothetical protein
MAKTTVDPVGWERALMAAEKVKERLRRATRALETAGIRYAVAGGNAVAEWVGRIDDDAVRNTRDVDILIRRPDFPAARACLEAVGFIYHKILDIDTFIDGPQGKPSGGIHLLFAGEKVRPDDDYDLPNIEASERAIEFQVVNLEALLIMKLTSYRLKDKVHILDMIGVGLVDASWPARLPSQLGVRLQQLLDDPNG